MKSIAELREKVAETKESFLSSQDSRFEVRLYVEREYFRARYELLKAQVHEVNKHYEDKRSDGYLPIVLLLNDLDTILAEHEEGK